MKTLTNCITICCLLNLFFFGKSFAQDVIYKNDKTEIKSKVEEILETEIKYKKFENLDGPLYSIKKENIFMIIYAKGQREIFENVTVKTNISPASKAVTKSEVIEKRTEIEIKKPINTTEVADKISAETPKKKKTKKSDNEIVVMQDVVITNNFKIDTKYRRSSLYTLITTDPTREYESDIVNYFEDKMISDKYNNHNLNIRKINAISGNRSNELDNIVDFLERNKIANQIVAKWFNRSSKGGFDVNLIKERGFYNANELDIATAKASTAGISRLADAGKDLIDNTFILVNDSKYTNKEVVASGLNFGLSMLTQFTGVTATSEIAKFGVTTFGKGFIVSTKAHLFKLVWDEETEAKFYSELWATDSDITPIKKAAFDNANFFALEYIGTDSSSADVQSTVFANRSNSELIGRATLKSVDNVITKLQQNYDVFKTQTPIYSLDPISAKIGLKEGLTNKTKFEVLEKQIDKNGIAKFVQKGIVKVDSDYAIWDNRYGADEENPNQENDKTYFKVIKGDDFYPGLLLKQIK